MDHLLTYLAIYGILVAEGTIVVGAFVPGFNTAISAAFLASTDKLDLLPVFIAVWLGIFTADYLGYLIGRHGIDRLASVRRLVKRLHRRVDKTLEERQKLLNFYQFVGFARSPLPIFFGAIRWPARRWTFLLLRATSLLTITMVLGSYLLGNLVGEQNALRIAAASQIVGIVLLFIITGQAYLRYRRSRKSTKSA